MPSERSANDVLDRDFLEIRRDILNIAAAIDRVGATADHEALKTDPRVGKILQALNILIDPERDKSIRVQMAFSIDYDPEWQANKAAASHK